MKSSSLKELGPFGSLFFSKRKQNNPPDPINTKAKGEKLKHQKHLMSPYFKNWELKPSS